MVCIVMHTDWYVEKSSKTRLQTGWDTGWYFLLSLHPGVPCQLSAGMTTQKCLLKLGAWALSYHSPPEIHPCSSSPVHLNHKNCTDMHRVQYSKLGLCFVFLLVKSVTNSSFQKLGHFLLCKKAWGEEKMPGISTVNSPALARGGKERRGCWREGRWLGQINM